MEGLILSRSSRNFTGQLDYVSQWLLMDSPVPVFLIWTSYLLFVLKLGPNVMKKRPPFHVNSIMIIYNAVQVIVSGYIFYLGGRVMLSHGLYAKCPMGSDDTLKYVTTLHYFFLAKTIELLDTVFFVLRKKDQQATFLHIYHHSYMMLSVWFTLKYEPSYTTIFPGALNCLIHVLMYIYYGLSAFPSMVKYLWWKKYLTTLQLIQFPTVFCHVYISLVASECPPSRIMVYQMCANTALFLGLFVDFYIKSYWKKKN